MGVFERCSQRKTRALVLGTLMSLSLLGGCQHEFQLQTPVALHAPYAEERTWAVVPLRNESGVSDVDALRLSDSFVTEIDGVEGLRCLPLNRSLTAMRALDMRAVVTEADAKALLETLQVEGLLVGSITAYDPYRPLQLGIAAQVYTVDQPPARVDSPEALFLAVTETDAARRKSARSDFEPSAQISRVYDGRNHDILRRLDVYARARAAPQSGFRDGIYLASIEAFSRFVAYDLMEAILAQEAANLAATEGATTGRAQANASGR